MAQEEILQAGALAALAQFVGVTEDLCHALYDGNHLVPAHKRIQALAKGGLSRQPATDAK